VRIQPALALAVVALEGGVEAAEGAEGVAMQVVEALEAVGAMGLHLRRS